MKMEYTVYFFWVDRIVGFKDGTLVFIQLFIWPNIIQYHIAAFVGQHWFCWPVNQSLADMDSSDIAYMI